MVYKESTEVKTLNEMIVKTSVSLDPEITNTVYYPRLKQLMFKEIASFCREKIEFKEDLMELQQHIGERLSEAEIREYLDGLKLKYNMIENIGLDYHIEATRVDYGVVIFAVIKRTDIETKKFIFRYRKSSTDTLFGISTNGVSMVMDKTQESKRDQYYDSLISTVSEGGI